MAMKVERDVAAPAERVWEIIKRHEIRPHPGYYLGWGRLSCMLCIFGDKDQWASARELDLKAFNRVAKYEKLFDMTIDRNLTVTEMADRGTSFLGKGDKGLAYKAYKKVALSTSCPPEYLMVRPGMPWILPAGAFKKAGGPT